TGKKAVKTFAKKRIPEFGVRPCLTIGVKVTLRKDGGLKLFPPLLKAIDNTKKQEWFDDEGNITFGIEEYIHIPNVSYDPSLGVVGLSVTIKLERPGFRVKRRRYRRSKIGKKHKIKKEEAIEFMKQKFGVKVV
ncbi:MAG TPA: 50S ribosomal protein L5, partial [Candidatus Aenigmarchaeota archaeon]|nr:50S ribosomal protein L5 [Candidatus Aenigmarchaeota archaeon]